MIDNHALYIRADASERLGTGHVMRCLSLAQGWMTHGDVTFVMALSDRAIRDRVTSTGAAIMEIEAEIGSEEDARLTALACEGQLLVIDGYNFGPRYQSIVKESGACVLMVDDLAKDGPYSVDLLLNYNFYGRPELYPSIRDTHTLLLGPRYFLLRREFLTWKDVAKDIRPSVARVLVTLGGSDPQNFTPTVLSALDDLSMEVGEIKVVMGPSNSHLEDICAQAERSPHHVDVLTNVRDMPSVMAWADLAISGAGTTSLELAYMGVPTIIVEVASNQKPNAQAISSLRLMKRAGWHDRVTVSQLATEVQALNSNIVERRRMSAACREAVDGLGAERALQALINTR